MRSNIFVENCGFTHIPATMTFFGEDLFYKINDVSNRLIKGFSFIAGTGTNSPLGEFILLRSRRKAITTCSDGVCPYN